MWATERQEKLLRTSKVDGIVRDPIELKGRLRELKILCKAYRIQELLKVNRWKFWRLYVEKICPLETKLAINWISIHLKRRLRIISGPKNCIESRMDHFAGIESLQNMINHQVSNNAAVFSKVHQQSFIQIHVIFQKDKFSSQTLRSFK